jgi:hypothetical protein
MTAVLPTPESSALAADSQDIAAGQPGLAAQLAVAAYRASPTEDATAALYAALQSPLLRGLRWLWVSLGHLWRKSLVMPATTAVASTQPNMIMIQVRTSMNIPQPPFPVFGIQLAASRRSRPGTRSWKEYGKG